ncbi:aminotransferase class V-fold PLP-dependent enzyme [Aquirufa sp. HETE-83D]|uniref:Aminotransferase class V-fold PLP-dependent enzyme n=1 Tax=Aquirufa esocilacus TaxID=3096513 RepID=A0ABW6DJ75_9BACT
MLSFYPGPSKVHPEALGYIQEAFDQGIVSINHRSPRFEKLLEATFQELHQKWNIPNDYTIYFVSSATEAWEIVVQSLVRKKSTHLFNGAFGKKWAHYAAEVAEPFEFSINQSLSDISQKIGPITGDTLCLVQSETSNGTGQQIRRSDFQLTDDTLIAVDATSSMGGMELPWNEADVWLASVQKCIGIPAGMGILLCSPKALARAKELGRETHYNDVLFLEENRRVFQTQMTPNVLSIYLVYRLTQQLPILSETHRMTLEKMKRWTDFWDNHSDFSYLIENPELRLPTVLALTGDPEKIKKLHKICLNKGIELGKGYGDWKKTSFRIANFPSHTFEDIETLIQTITNEL